MLSVQNTDGRTRLWYDGRHLLLRDLHGIPVARIKGSKIYALNGQRVASWKDNNVVDLDGTVLLRGRSFGETPEPRVPPVLLPHEDLLVRPPRRPRKPWGDERGFVETLRLISRDQVRITNW
jgi:hypothetical protein